MATMRITEYSNLGLNENAQIPQEPAVGSQSVTFTTATSSVAFNEKTRYVKLNPDANCRVLFGPSASSPTAVAGSEFLLANTDHWRGVKAGHVVSVYDGVS